MLFEAALRTYNDTVFSAEGPLYVPGARDAAYDLNQGLEPIMSDLGCDFA